MIRRKYVVLTPEEWVRQHLIHYLVNQLNYPAGLMKIEKEIKVNNLKRRPDVVVFNHLALPVLIAECKAPDVKVTQDTFDQAARYNRTLQVNLFVLTNGFNTYCCTFNSEERNYRFLEEVPDYNFLKNLTAL
jgi:type I site-specific restriction-modification system R (restriction) subunit